MIAVLRRASARLSPWSWGTIALALVFVLLAAHGALGTGMSWDEDDHRAYGRWVVEWYANPDWEAPTHERMSQYGALFGVVCTLLERVFSSASHITVRHLASAAFALVGLIFAVRAARALGGPAAGFFTALLLASTPRWVGHAMFNPIDVPFAAGMAVALDALVRLLLELPAPRVRAWIWLGVATGTALGVRIGGVLILVYLGVLLCAYVVHPYAARRDASARPSARTIGRLALGVCASTLFAYATAAVFWPYLLTNPWSHTLELLRSSTSFPWRGTILFDGRLIDSYQPEKSYLPTWFAITSPPLQFVAILALFVRWRVFWTTTIQARSALAAVLLACTFPPLYALASGAILYDGMRHFLFVVPALAVLGGCGLAEALRAMQSVRLRFAAGLVIVACVAEPALWFARAHPLSYVYFNPLVGGLSRASHSYETDYWGVSLRAAAEWIDRNRQQIAGDGELVVGSNASWHLMQPWFADTSRVRFWRDSREPAHVLVEYYRHRSPGWHRNGPAVYEARWDAEQVPFFRIHLGALARSPSKR